ncbi:MAG: S4 domain-containing protein [Gammaproteobacteria bacterium]|nr:S4 domain-containing protein [Gammaproteobacteria bacterium]
MNTRRESPDEAAPGEVRIDRWLWAARFFKTRQLAVAALKAGHVEHNGRKAKPSRPVRRGISSSFDATRRASRSKSPKFGKSASAPNWLNRCTRETDESIARREQIEAQRAAGARSVRYGDGRPGKKERRELARVKRGGLP